MGRYVGNENLRNFHSKVREEIERIGALAKSSAGYVIYAIHDPSEEDPRGKYDEGLPVYVGQSKQLRSRANSHMRDGGGGSLDDTIKGDRLKQIMDKYVVPKFRLVDTAPTHLTSLIAETVWARRYVWLGYELANQWPEHRTSARPEGLKSVPSRRLHRLTVAEAVEDEVVLTLDCRRCGVFREVDLRALDPQIKFGAIRSLKPKCGVCGKPVLRVRKPDAVTWRWRAYTPSPMSPLTRKATP